MTPDPELQPEFFDGVPSKRLYAWVLDSIVVTGLTLLSLPFTFFIGLLIWPVLFALIDFSYRVVTLSRGSATWGMRLMAVELRRSDDRKFEPTDAFWHTLGYYISIAMAPLQLVSIVLMLSSQRRQGLSDLALGTVALNRRA